VRPIPSRLLAQAPTCRRSCPCWPRCSTRRSRAVRLARSRRSRLCALQGPQRACASRPVRSSRTAGAPRPRAPAPEGAVRAGGAKSINFQELAADLAQVWRPQRPGRRGVSASWASVACVSQLGICHAYMWMHVDACGCMWMHVDACMHACGVPTLATGPCMLLTVHARTQITFDFPFVIPPCAPERPQRATRHAARPASARPSARGRAQVLCAHHPRDQRAGGHCACGRPQLCDCGRRAPSWNSIWRERCNYGAWRGAAVPSCQQAVQQVQDLIGVSHRLCAGRQRHACVTRARRLPRRGLPVCRAAAAHQ